MGWTGDDTISGPVWTGDNTSPDPVWTGDGDDTSPVNLNTFSAATKRVLLSILIFVVGVVSGLRASSEERRRLAVSRGDKQIRCLVPARQLDAILYGRRRAVAGLLV